MKPAIHLASQCLCINEVLNAYFSAIHAPYIIFLMFEKTEVLSCLTAKKMQSSYFIIHSLNNMGMS